MAQKLLATFQEAGETRPLFKWEIFPTTIAFQAANDIISMPRKHKVNTPPKKKMRRLFVDTSEDFRHLCVFFLWHVQYVNRSYEHLSYFIYSIKDVPNTKHPKKFLPGRENPRCAGVHGCSLRRYRCCESSFNTCRALDTTGPNYIRLPPLLNNLFSLTGQGDNQSHLK